MGSRARNALRFAGGALMGAMVALGFDLFAAMLAFIFGSDGPERGLVFIAVGGPIAIVIGAVIGAIVRGRGAVPENARASTGGSRPTKQSYRLVSWIVGVIASVVVGIGMVPIVTAALMATYMGLEERYTLAIASLVIPPAAVFSMVMLGRWVMRHMEGKASGNGSLAE